MIKIKEIKVRNILNSEGRDALEVEMLTEDNIKAIASSPSAIIPGRREILTTSHIHMNSLNQMIEEIYCKEFNSQSDFDNFLNQYMEKLGTNVCLPFSLAYARICAKNQNMTLVEYIRKIANYHVKNSSPIPLVAIFSGGIHNQEEKGSIQNIMMAVDIHPFSKSVPVITEIYTDIENEVKRRNILKYYGASSGMIVPRLTEEEKMKMLEETIKRLHYEKYVSIAIDVAAEHFYKNENYEYNGQILNSQKLDDILMGYIQKYNITYVEDPFDSDDIQYWKLIKEQNQNIAIVGDDLFATQDKYINSELANGIIIKMNQVGTLTDTINAFLKAKEENMVTCVSQRSIETEDTFMCDLAVALGSTYIKIGGPRRGDRIAKYNCLLRLEEEDSEVIK